MPEFFDRTKDVLSKKSPGEIFNAACGGPEGVASKDGGHKNPADQADPARNAGGARRQGVLSFGYFSLHKQRLFFAQAKKSDSLRSEAGAKAFDLCV